MKKLYSFKWFQFNLKVECTKCGNNIVFQDFKGSPECNSCGNENKFPWTNVLQEIGVTEVPSGRWGNRKLMAAFNASANVEPAEFIDCYHCKAHLLLPDNTDTKNFNCTSCSQPLSFHEYPEFKDLIFYRSGGTGQSKEEEIRPVAVRCVSCGAPLEVDPTKNNFSCKFCSTENILPKSMRYKIVLADIFVADKKARYPKLFTFEQDGKIIEQVLRVDGKASFQDGTLDAVLLSEKNDLNTYSLILKENKYRPSDKILKEIFSTSSNQAIIELSGIRLQKSQQEIDDRIQEINPNYKKAKKEVARTVAKNKIKNQVEVQSKKIFSLGNVIVVVTFIIVGIILLSTFGII